MQLVKARLEDDEGHAVDFQFNPDSISFTKSATWREQRTQTAQDGPVQQFEGANAISLTLDMLLDDVERGSETVMESVNLLASWTNPTASSRDTQNPAAAELSFAWGQFKIGQAGNFACHLKSVGVNYTMFRPNGIPLRANAKIELTSTQTINWRQNPTSGGKRPQRRRILQRGDRLGVIAAREYGDARYWRQIADFNGLDDPFVLPVGRPILLPAADELEAL